MTKLFDADACLVLCTEYMAVSTTKPFKNSNTYISVLWEGFLRGLPNKIYKTDSERLIKSLIFSKSKAGIKLHKLAFSVHLYNAIGFITLPSFGWFECCFRRNGWEIIVPFLDSKSYCILGWVGQH